jgi:DNA-binding transcriptional regulator YhcF (GntR family)
MNYVSNGNGHLQGPPLLGLPALEAITPRTNATEQKSALILRLLRQRAQENRTKNRQPFYSIRAVANHFGVPVTTVSRIYGRLKDEGLLAAVWGSKTFVESTQIDKQSRIRAVVALPASLSSFCSVRNYRAFFLSMRDALWRLGFATRLLFYEGHDAEQPSFAELLLSYKVDVVIWYMPNPKCNDTAASLTDHGIRLITIDDYLPSRGQLCYYPSRQQALKKGLIAWQKAGIASVTVVRAHSCKPIARLPMIEACLREADMRYAFANIGSGFQRNGLNALSQGKDSAFIFPSSNPVVQLVSRAPAEFEQLINHSRVMLVEGSVDFPAFDTIDGVVDLIEIDWQLAAAQIGRDLLSLGRSASTGPITFEAQWHPQRPLSAGTRNV